MRKISKKIIVLLLVAVVAIAGAVYIGFSELEDVSGGTGNLQAGDWVFFDVSGNTEFASSNAIMRILYVSNSYENSTNEKNIIMTKYSDNIYCAKIPSDMGNNGYFKFYRSDPDTGNGWNYAPNNSWLQLGGSQNIYKVSGWDSGSWNGSWKDISSTDKVLKAGDKVYLDISNCSSSWTLSSAVTRLVYIDNNGSTKYQVMESYGSGTNKYVTTIPTDIGDDGKFRFDRASSANSSAWNIVPSNAWLRLDAVNKNVFKIVHFDDDSNTGIWNEYIVSNNAGKTVYFLNMEGIAIDGLKAKFTVSSGSSATETKTMTYESGVMAGLYSVTIPSSADYDTVTFIDSLGTQLSTEKVLNGTYNPSTTNTYYYNLTTKSGGTIVSKWDTYPTANSSIAGKKLYFDNSVFSVNKTVEIQIGTGASEVLSLDSLDKTIYSHTIPSNSGVTQRTVITVKMDGNTYHFLWSELGKKSVGYVSTDILGVNGDYSVPPLSAGDWLYLDATAAPSWTKSGDNATVIKLAYMSGSTTKYEVMQVCGDYIYRVKIPDDMTQSTKFWFERYKYDGTTWWDSAPNEGTSDSNHQPTNCLYLTSTELGGVNTYKITDSSFSSSWGGWTVSNFAGKLIYFMNMNNSSLDGLSAVFSVSTSSDTTKTEIMTAVSDKPGLYKVTIPDGADYDNVKFITSLGDISGLQNIMDGSYVPDENNTYYYNITEKGNGSNICIWDVCPTSTKSIAGGKLYFDRDIFKVSEGKTITLQIGTETPITLTIDAEDASTYSYTIPSNSSATQMTVITVTMDGDKYHFLWTNMNRECVNYVSESRDILGVNADYEVLLPATRYIYFDATLSKLPYTGTNDAGDISIPRSGSSVIYCKVWKSSNTSDSKTIQMTKQSSLTKGNNTWSDVYRVEIDSSYDMVMFYSDGRSSSGNADRTVEIEISKGIVHPCFYADTSDAKEWGTSNRSGYWGEVYEIRDVQTGKDRDVVDIPAEEFKRDEEVLYVNTTLYDYFSDFELNGLNRDDYPSDDIHTHRIYQPFRQFNQALSAYYEKNQAKSPLYWGNVQNYDNSQNFNQIGDTLALYGYSSSWDIFKKFLYENNAMWGIDGTTLSDSKVATIGLASNSLYSGKLMLDSKTTGSTFIAPFFDKEFINGANSKNTVLGDIYENVAFPFVRERIDVTTVNGNKSIVKYWYYDSSKQGLKNSNLQLRKYSDNDNKYFLTSTDEKVYGQGSGSTNFFPFNDKSQSGSMSKLNYGFGQKLEFNFRLTENGTVVAENGEKAPIEFVFDGDDDVWIFIDGVLILDIGGAHGKVEGTINFKDRYGKVSQIKPTGGGSTIDTTYQINFPDSMQNADFYNKEHTLTMYYMERGLFESNMVVRFNFPDEDKLSIQKEVNTDKVNDLFKDLFDGKSVFTFNIRNQATHYGETLVQTGNEPEAKIYNQTFEGNVQSANSTNICEYVEEINRQTDVVHWYAKLEDIGGNYAYKRWGIIYPDTGKGTTINVSEQSAYLQFIVYYPHYDTATLSSMRIEVEDANNNKIGGSIQGKTYGNSSIKSREWTTLCIDLRKFDGYSSMDFTKIANIKFDYDYPKDIYLDEFTFKPTVSATTLVGFTTEQYQMPDYGSSTSGKLENAVNALYTTATETGELLAERVDKNGNFVLADGQKITFSNQFRKGSYIYLEEKIDETLFDVTWEIYENGDKVTSSIAPSDSSKVTGGYQSFDGYNKGTMVSDGRIEGYESGNYTEGSTVKPIQNAGYTKAEQAKLDADTYTDKTIVFRSYDFPDSAVASIDLLIKEINTVKTGALTIKKEQATGSQSLEDQEFTIRIEFTNVAGLALESAAIVYEVKLKAGESETIEGIPVGTIYTIKEIVDDTSDIKLESITQTIDMSSNVIGNDLVLITGTTMAQGQILEDTDASTANGFVFTNSLTPTIKLNLNKLWVASDGITNVTEGLPESIWVQIQRKAEEDAEYNVVDVPGAVSGCIEIVPGYDGWIKQIVGLEKYKDNESSKPYTYKVVEMQKQSEDSFIEVRDTFWYDGSEYEVSYTDNIVLSSTNTAKEYSFSITNKILELFDFSFTKVTGSVGSLSKILGAEFILYEYKGEASLSTYEEIMNAIAGIAADSTLWVKHELKDTDSDSIYSKTGLSRKSVYYLVETRVPTGMQSPNGCWKIKFVTDSSTGDGLVHDNVKITPIPKSTASDMPAIGYEKNGTNDIEGWFITNLKQWDIPETGGIGLTYPYMAGICLMLLAVVWGGTLYYRDRRQKRT